MLCTTCGKDCPDLLTGERFCTDCGCDAAAHQANVAPVISPPPVQPVDPVAVAPPPQSGVYEAEISRAQPGCLIFLVDHSGSMTEPIASDVNGRQTKKDAVADAINRILQVLIKRCTRGTEVWDYFDVGLWTYGGNDDVTAVFGSELTPISKVAASPKRIEERTQIVPDGAGGTYPRPIKFPVWLEPIANGNTPMKRAFETAAGPLREWVARHQNSFPPVIIHLTDGSFTGEDPAPLIWSLMGLRTIDGNVLVFNCHLSKEPRPELVLPGDGAAAGLQGLQRYLYDVSSPLPAPMRATASQEEYRIEPGARGYVYNSKHTTMVTFLNIGTRAVQDRME